MIILAWERLLILVSIAFEFFKVSTFPGTIALASISSSPGSVIAQTTLLRMVRFSTGTTVFSPLRLGYSSLLAKAHASVGEHACQATPVFYNLGSWLGGPCWAGHSTLATGQF